MHTCVQLVPSPANSTCVAMSTEPLSSSMPCLFPVLSLFTCQWWGWLVALLYSSTRKQPSSLKALKNEMCRQWKQLCTLMYCVLCTLCTMYSMHYVCTLCSMHSMYYVLYVLCTVCTMYPMYYALYILCTLCSMYVQCV